MSMQSGPTSVSLPVEFTNNDFKRRRTQNWLVLGFLYAFFYMTRYNFAAVMGNLSETFGWNNTQLGVFETMMPLIYGLSVVFNGPICDRVGGKKAFLFGAVGVTIMNFLFGLCILAVQTPAVVSGHGHAMQVTTQAVLGYGFTPGSLLTLMAIIWGINGYFQSFGALSIIKVNAQWFHMRERGFFSGIFGILIRMGLIFAFSGVPFILTLLPLQYAFFIPGLAVGILFVLNLFLMENSPKDAGFEGLDTGDEVITDDRPPQIGYILKKVFASRATWIIAFTSMMLGMVRRSTIDSWYPKYFKETFLADGATNIAQYIPYQTTVWLIAIFGIAGSFIFGIASDRIYKGRRAPVVTFAFIGMVVLLLLLGSANMMEFGPWATAICLSVLSLFVNGAHGIISGVASMDFGGRKAAATAAGLFDGMQYLASSMVGIGMGLLLDNWGWKAWPFAPIPFAIIGGILICQLWNVVPGKKNVATQEKK